MLKNIKSSEQIGPSTRMNINLSNLKPDSEQHYLYYNQNHYLQLTFRYFSPQKLKMSQLSPHQLPYVTREPTHTENSSRIAEQNVSIMNERRSINPQAHSDKFYKDNIGQIGYNISDYYQQFNQKLLNQSLGRKQNKIIKLRLSKQSRNHFNKQNKKQPSFVKKVKIQLKNNKNNKTNNFSNKKISGKKIINLTRSYSNQKDMSNQKQSNKVNLDKKPDLIIKLYQSKNKQQPSKHKNNIEDSTKIKSLDKLSNDKLTLITPRPRTDSKRKGISVYSSSTNKQSLLQSENRKHNNSNNISFKSTRPTFDNNPLQISNPAIENDIAPNSNLVHRIKHLLSNNKKSYKNESLTKNAGKTRKRVYSKQKITEKYSPIKKLRFN